MTPKEKAKELVSKFENLVDDCADSVYEACGHKAGKGCALICVDEIIKALDSANIIYGSEYRYEETIFWEIVKQETIKL